MANAPLERGPGDHRWCDERIAAVEAENALLKARIGELEDQNAELLSRFAALETLVSKLAAQQNGGGR